MFASHVLVRVFFEVLRSVFSQNYADTPMESAFCSQSQTWSHFYHQVKRQEFWKTGARVATKSFWKRGMASLWHQYHRLGSQKCVIHMHHSQTSVIRVPITQKKVICTYLLTEWEGRTELYLSRGHDVRTKYVMTSRSTIHLFLIFVLFWGQSAIRIHALGNCNSCLSGAPGGFFRLAHVKPVRSHTRQFS